MAAKLQKKVVLDYLNTLVLILSVYVLVALAVSTFFKLPEQINRLLNLLDDSICVFFLLEFCIRLYQAENKLAYLKWGWIDLISSIPAFPFLRAGRLFRLIRLLRVLRAFRSTKHLTQYIFRNKAYGAFTTVSVIAVVMVLFSSIAMLQVEHDPNSNIKTAEDAIWWAWVTVTTVGYGDKYPVTTEGRIIASGLMAVGVGLLGTFTGLMASWFLSEKKSREKNEAEMENKAIDQTFFRNEE
jgi:voltage-gated potassium channel